MNQLLKIFNTGAFTYSALTVSILTSYMLGGLLYNSIIENNSFIDGIIVISLITVLLIGLLFFGLNKISSLRNPIALDKKILNIFFIIDIIAIILGSSVANNNATILKTENEIKKQEIRKKQEAYNKLSTEEKEKIKEDNRKIELERLKNEEEQKKINQMPREEREDYFKEKGLFANMTPKQIENYQVDKLTKKWEEIQEKKQLEAAVGIVKILKETMHNPNSFELEKIHYYKDNNYCIEYSARNLFNARVKGNAVVTNKGKMYIEQYDGNKFVNNWNKYCTRPSIDYTKMIKIYGGFTARE